MLVSVVMTIMTLHNCAFVLAFLVIFIAVHVLFQNLRQILLQSCKIVIATYIWAVLWVIVQINQLPEWQNQLRESVSNLVNMTKENLGHMREL